MWFNNDLINFFYTCILFHESSIKWQVTSFWCKNSSFDLITTSMYECLIKELRVGTFEIALQLMNHKCTCTCNSQWNLKLHLCNCSQQNLSTYMYVHQFIQYNHEYYNTTTCLVYIQYIVWLVVLNTVQIRGKIFFESVWKNIKSVPIVTKYTFFSLSLS